jgi:hypothetical protein
MGIRLTWPAIETTLRLVRTHDSKLPCGSTIQ